MCYENFALMKTHNLDVSRADTIVERYIALFKIVNTVSEIFTFIIPLLRESTVALKMSYSPFLKMSAFVSGGFHYGKLVACRLAAIRE